MGGVQIENTDSRAFSNWLRFQFANPKVRVHPYFQFGPSLIQSRATLSLTSKVSAHISRRFYVDLSQYVRAISQYPASCDMKHCPRTKYHNTHPICHRV